ncbi:2OG-Fe dioxygenase family protein [Mesorhizobium sp. IMUNJ 23033]|uniref:2OG-Fe dioxygenase family protein n=1 Tax=Mesorhizobium sp. IMUNJ 23033 TaxID=3378039 RepID=UPI00384BC376
MVHSGFCYLKGDEFILTNEEKAELAKVQDHFAVLPRDPYGQASNRYRQFSRYLLIPFAGLLIPRPERTPTYRQHAAFNDEAPDLARQFEAIPGRFLSSDLIRALIVHDFQNSPFDEHSLSLPFEVGLHFIRLQAEPDKPGIAVPNRLHKDGEPFTWIHLINRSGVTGGENIVTDNEQANVLCEAILNSPLDTIGIVDDQVWHQVKPVYAEAHVRMGFRDVVLVDFTPMVAKPLEPRLEP